MAKDAADTGNRFGEWLRNELSRHEWSQRMLAEKVGVSSGVVSRWVRGLDIPSSPSIIGIAAAFKVPAQVVMNQIGSAQSAEQHDFWTMLSSELDTEDLRDVQDFIDYKRAQARKRKMDAKS
jgi:transcriptional regulator with XRE-family HTH domain